MTPRFGEPRISAMDTWPRRIVAGALVLAASACTGGGGSASAPASIAPGSAAPATIAPSAGAAGGLSVGSLLGGTPGEPPGTSWIQALDAGAPFTFQVPSSWTGHVASSWREGASEIGTVLAAGPDPTKLATDFSVPGIAIGVSANEAGRTAHQVVEADTGYAGTCTPGAIEDAVDAGISASFRLWESCAGGSAYLLSMAIVPAGGEGLIAIVFQGVTEGDLGYLQHIVGSLEATGAAASPTPASTGGRPDPGQPYAISMDACVNQHGQGVAEGLIRNDDVLVHSFRIVVAFSDPNGILLNDTWGTTPNVPPGVTARWQAVVPSGLPNVAVACQITGVELVN
jgi:catechol 2,3-dioxygenase-like lactoylglutathione lyase family enzyme